MVMRMSSWYNTQELLTSLLTKTGSLVCQTASNTFHFFGFLSPAFAVLEPVRIVARFQDVAVMGNAIQQGRRHLGIAKHLPPLAER